MTKYNIDKFKIICKYITILLVIYAFQVAYMLLILEFKDSINSSLGEILSIVFLVFYFSVPIILLILKSSINNHVKTLTVYKKDRRTNEF